MRGDAIAQGEKRLEPVLPGFAKIFHVVEAFSSAQQCADGDDEHVDQIVILRTVDSPVSQIFKMFDETNFRMLLHPMLFKHMYQKYKRHFVPPFLDKVQNLDASALGAQISF
jgi:hypothetical protein